MKQTDFHIDPDDLRRAMRRWATGVTIVSSQHAGVQHGMTVSSFTSVTLNPPLVLVSIESGTRTHQLIESSGVYAVTVLSADQQEISNRFAGRQTELEDRFGDLPVYHLRTGCPLLSNGLAGFDCVVVSSFQVGSHTIFVGNVVAVQTLLEENVSPLLYFDRNYRFLCDE